MVSKRGRPAGSREGAREAVADIVAARKALGLSENELASRTGLSQSTVNRLLNAEEPAWTPALTRLSNYAKNIATLEPLVGTHRRASERMLVKTLLDLWDGTTNGADRLLRLLHVVDEIRRAAAPSGGGRDDGTRH